MKEATLKKLKFSAAPLPAGMQARNFHALVATWFGAGRLRPAPGTMGSLAAIPPGYVIGHFFGSPGLFVAALALFVLGCISSDVYGKKSGQPDDQSIVVDEVAGMWVAAIPAVTNIELWIAAFLFFRFFDIYKPWPASYFDNRKGGGTDVMMDDIVAGLFAFFGVAAMAFYSALYS